jgi:inner membrane protein
LNICRVDNITHSLAGVLVAELALDLRRRMGRGEPDEKTTRAAWITSIVANNAPDLDLILTPLTGGHLGYLLHHRGHTHTLALAPIVAMVPVLLGWLYARRAKGPFDVPFQVALALIGCCVHMALDFGNSYGVHPFWPLNNAWFFGDTLFIIEPLLWVVMSAPLVFGSKRLWPRVAFATPPLLAVGLAIVSGAVLPPFVAVLGALTPLLMVLSTRLLRVQRMLVAGALTLVVIAGFASQSMLARGRAEVALQELFPEASVHDIALSPMPGNPFCWTGFGVMTEGDWLIDRRFALSTWPSMMSAEGCHTEPPMHTTAPRVPTVVRSPVDVWMIDEVRVPLGRLRALYEEDCFAAAYMRFARVPYLVEGADVTVLGDVRYDRSPELEWVEAELPGGEDAPRTCPALVPNWEPPRLDVLTDLPAEEPAPHAP